MALLKGKNSLLLCKYCACFSTQFHLFKCSLQKGASINNFLPGTIKVLSHTGSHFSDIFFWRNFTFFFSSDKSKILLVYNLGSTEK